MYLIKPYCNAVVGLSIVEKYVRELYTSIKGIDFICKVGFWGG